MGSNNWCLEYYIDTYGEHAHHMTITREMLNQHNFSSQESGVRE